MIAAARRRSTTERLTNTRFVVGDAQVYPFGLAAFDVVISRFGGMFFGNPVAGFTNLARALRDDGRLALLSRPPLANNDWVLILRDTLPACRSLPQPPPGTPGPFALADPHDVQRVFTAAGFHDIELTEVREPMYLGADTMTPSTSSPDSGLPGDCSAGSTTPPGRPHSRRSEPSSAHMPPPTACCSVPPAGSSPPTAPDPTRARSDPTRTGRRAHTVLTDLPPRQRPGHPRQYERGVHSYPSHRVLRTSDSAALRAETRDLCRR